jgi:hypothetical protein
LPKNTQIRNANRKFDTPFLFYTDAPTLSLIRATAEQNDMSVAQFLRQAAKRNLQQYAGLAK